jgi:hypothetical protein
MTAQSRTELRQLIEEAILFLHLGRSGAAELALIVALRVIASDDNALPSAGDARR